MGLLKVERQAGQEPKVDPSLSMRNEDLWLHIVVKNRSLRREHVDLLMAEYLAGGNVSVANLWRHAGLEGLVVYRDLVFSHWGFNYEREVLPSEAALKDIYSYCTFGAIYRDLETHRVEPAEGNLGFEVLERFQSTPIGREIDEVHYKLFSHTLEHNRRDFARPHLILASPDHTQPPSVRWFEAQ